MMNIKENAILIAAELALSARSINRQCMMLEEQMETNIDQWLRGDIVLSDLKEFEKRLSIIRNDVFDASTTISKLIELGKDLSKVGQVQMILGKEKRT